MMFSVQQLPALSRVLEPAGLKRYTSAAGLLANCLQALAAAPWQIRFALAAPGKSAALNVLWKTGMASIVQGALRRLAWA